MRNEENICHIVQDELATTSVTVLPKTDNNDNSEKYIAKEAFNSFIT